ncbi:MAG: response regulator, partial [Candidatus Rokuibacteriota bacterium]
MNRTVLYIDPDPATRVLVRKVLGPAGFTVVDAEDWRHGSELAERSHPAVVLIDVDAVGAVDVLQTFRQRRGLAGAVLLASTAEDRPEHWARTMELGFRGIVMKPLDVDTLPRELGRHLGPIGSGSPTPAAIINGARSTPARRVHALWRPTLAPLAEAFIRSAATAYGVLALRDESGPDLVVVAAHSVRPAEDMPAIGTRIPMDSVPWLHAAAEARQPVLLPTDSVDASPLVPPASTMLLAVPLAAGDRTFGVALLGARRKRPFGLPEAQIARCVSEAARIGA